jgi:3-methyladenine DNA glycosylase AlkD
MPTASGAQIGSYHDEIIAALRPLSNAERGEAIRIDRGSQLQHLGISFPALRKRVKQGFSFYALTEAEVLQVWDALWQTSPYGDVLFAALEYYLPRLKRHVPPCLWPKAMRWISRVDNWCHSDALSTLYSRLLAADVDAVYPQLVAWNASHDEWQRRISLTSLIHYTGKNAVFLAPAQMLPLVANCVTDHRKYVALSVGWVTRELRRAHQEEAMNFIERHAASMSTAAFSRALEGIAQEERVRLLALRKAKLSKSHD